MNTWLYMPFIKSSTLYKVLRKCLANLLMSPGCRYIYARTSCRSITKLPELMIRTVSSRARTPRTVSLAPLFPHSFSKTNLIRIPMHAAFYQYFKISYSQRFMRRMQSSDENMANSSYTYMGRFPKRIAHLPVFFLPHHQCEATLWQLSTSTNRGS